MIRAAVFLFALTASADTRDAGDALAKGEYENAIKFAEDAARAHAADPALAARDWEIAGQARVYKGEYAAAIQTLEKALALDRQSGGARFEIVDLYDIGGAYTFMGRYEDAYANYRAAIDLAESHVNEPWAPTPLRVARANLANLYQRLGRYQQALEIYRGLPAADVRPRMRAQMLSNQGTLYRRLGDPIKALGLYAEAQRLYAGDGFRDGEIAVLTNIGIARALDLEKPLEAAQAFESALKLALASGSALAAQTRLYLAETLRRAGRSDDAAREFAAALEGARDAKNADSEWRALHGVGQMEARAGRYDAALKSYNDAIAVIESMRSGLATQNFRREFLADKREVYDSAISLLLRNPDPPLPELFRLMEGGRARALQDKGQAADIESIRARLAPDTALLEYWTGPAEAAVLYLTRTSAGVLRRDAANTKPLADALSGASSADWTKLAAAAGEALLDGLPPIANPAIKRFIVVPDGELSRIPFEVLGERPFIRRGEISYLPSANLLRAANPTTGWRAPWSKELVAFADPPASKPGVFGVAPSLPQAVAEVNAIAAMLPGRSQIHTGSAARKELLTAADLSGLPILHIASHAAADPADSDRARIAFASGLLFPREIAGLRLSGAGLVVLSACETESGRLVRGEGVEGFSRAFLGAGAATTVTTLWRVEDSATANFMEQFYYRLAAGETKAEALRGAKLKFLESGGALAHPRYWAGFVMNGDGAARLPRVASWPVLAVSCAALLAAAAALRQRSSRRTFKPAI